MIDRAAAVSCFTYDAATGQLRHRSDGRPAGAILRSKRDDYASVRVYFGGRHEYAHRIIWVMVNGSIPEGMMIDHVNCDATDNRLSNLRLATPRENERNRRRSKNNSSGVPGVSFCRKTNRWHAYITAGPKRTNLGFFRSIEEAASARRRAEVEHFKDFAPRQRQTA